MASVATEVAPDRGERLLIWVGFPLVGAVAGGLVKALAGWAASWEWVPAHDALRLMASPAQPVGQGRARRSRRARRCRGGVPRRAGPRARDGRRRPGHARAGRGT